MPFAVVFPGQGSQSVGMLAGLADGSEVVADTIAEASEALGFDLGNLLREGPAEELNRTENTQPALLAAGIAVWRLWMERGGTQPAVLAGHSLGEYTALAAAGAIAFTDALRLVRQRGLFMQEAVPEGVGAMAAIIGLDAQTVTRLCSEAGSEGTVSAANFNSPAQIVISGQRAAVEKARGLAEAAGAKRVIPLAVSVPSHCGLMRPAAERLAAELSALELVTPAIPVVNNADVAAPQEAQVIADALVRQLTQSVRWTETVLSLRDDFGAQAVFEFGPGQVLTGLGKRIDRRFPGQAVNDTASLEKALEAAKDFS
ncbi:MAG: ACP S-malonyltransferase [Gammaproteobacteria bacterium]|nr:ACP S-malonyltransferase [Gammaproteobacteria bacterium]